MIPPVAPNSSSSYSDEESFAVERAQSAPPTTLIPRSKATTNVFTSNSEKLGSRYHERGALIRNPSPLRARQSFNIIRTTSIIGNIDTFKSVEAALKSLNKDPEANRTEIAALNKQLEGMKFNILTRFNEIVTTEREIEKIINEDPKLLCSILTKVSPFLEYEQINDAANKILNSCFPSQIVLLINEYLKTHIEQAVSDAEILRETNTILPRLLGLFQTKIFREYFGPDFDNTLKKHVIKAVLENDNEVSIKSVKQKAKEIFKDINELLASKEVSSELRSVYSTLHTHLLARFNNHDAALRRITSLFFLQTVCPSVVLGPKATQLGELEYKIPQDRTNGKLISKALQSVVNNEAPNDPKFAGLVKGNFLKNQQTIVLAIARNLLKPRSP